MRLKEEKGDSQNGVVQNLVLTEREATLRISKRRRAGRESWREWKAGEKSSLASQWDTEWGNPGDCGIGGLWALGEG